MAAAEWQLIVGTSSLPVYENIMDADNEDHIVIFGRVYTLYAYGRLCVPKEYLFGAHFK